MGYPLVNDKGEFERQTRTNTFIESTFQLDNMLAMAFSVGELLLVIECKRSRFQPGKVFASVQEQKAYDCQSFDSRGAFWVR